MSEGGWRIIMTDTEGLTGVAPTCPNQGDYTKHSTGSGYMQPPADESGVYDCCPQPHIECWSVPSAWSVMDVLNDVEAEICS